MWSIFAGPLGFRFWVFTFGAAFLFLLELFVLKGLIRTLGAIPVGAIFITMILAAGMIGSFLEWKRIQLEEYRSTDAT